MSTELCEHGVKEGCPRCSLLTTPIEHGELLPEYWKIFLETLQGYQDGTKTAHDVVLAAGFHYTQPSPTPSWSDVARKKIDEHFNTRSLDRPTQEWRPEDVRKLLEEAVARYHVCEVSLDGAEKAAENFVSERWPDLSTPPPAPPQARHLGTRRINERPTAPAQL